MEERIKWFSSEDFGQQGGGKMQLKLLVQMAKVGWSEQPSVQPSSCIGHERGGIIIWSLNHLKKLLMLVKHAGRTWGEKKGACAAWNFQLLLNNWQPRIRKERRLNFAGVLGRFFRWFWRESLVVWSCSFGPIELKWNGSMVIQFGGSWNDSRVTKLLSWKVLLESEIWLGFLT